MTQLSRAIHALAVIALALSCLMAAHCTYRPSPTPGTGGTVSTGGTSQATGGTSYDVAGSAGVAGSVIVATGGTPAIDWPECAPPTQKARPIVRHQLGRKHSAIKRKARASYAVLSLPDVFWRPLTPALDQRDLGACTGFATLQCRLSEPWKWSGILDIPQLEALARSIYSGATKRDIWPGTWPPTDTGSGGQWALDEALHQGVFAQYVAIDSFEDLQLALQKGPCISGVDWYDGFFSPDRCGAIKKTGAVVGGHEIVISGIRYSTKQILARTSWGEFGVDYQGKSGFFWWTFGDYQALIAAGGDIHCPIP